VREAAWPAIRTDLDLTYLEIGWILTIPGLVAMVTEPAIGLAGDTRHRRVLVAVGGLVVSGTLVLAGVAPVLGVFLLAECLMAPASGAFVSLSQASLMDLAPARRERNMARWMVAGSVGNVVGPLLLAGAVALSFSWRDAFLALAVVTLPLVVAGWWAHAPQPSAAESHEDRRPGARDLLEALRDREVLRWLAALEVGDLLGDVLLGFLALYLVDVAGSAEGIAGVAVAAWSAAGLVGGAVLVRLTRTIDGAWYLRASSWAALVLFPVFLLVPGEGPKIAAVSVVGVVTAGWYPIAHARLFGSLHGRSGVAVAVSSLAYPIGLLPPLVVAAVATVTGLQTALWLLMTGPLLLLLIVPRHPRRIEPGSQAPVS
jgi:FSR family fosmidomycin resistance protein-like MFS transporter